MTLVVNLGLERFFYGEPDALPLAVASLVEAGYTTLVREIIFAQGRSLEGAKILEVSRQDGEARSRFLSEDEAKPILADIKKVFDKHDTYASFSWDQLDRMPAYDIQPLALTLDGPEKPPDGRIKLPGVSDSMRVRDLTSSIKNWSARHPQARAATALHKLAQKHRLIVHSA
jgi:hypothetical protein